MKIVLAAYTQRVYNSPHKPPSSEDEKMVAYLHNAPKSSGGKFTLTLCASPCGGAEFSNAEKVVVQDKREARAICAARSAKPWNF